jgi:hypothetical protein
MVSTIGVVRWLSCVIVAASLLASGACRPQAAADELAPPFGLKWGMTEVEFVGLYRAKNGDAAAARLAPDRSSGVQSRVVLAAGAAGASWPPLLQAASATLDFSDEFGLVSVMVAGETVAANDDAASYDDLLKRYREAQASLIETYGQPVQVDDVNLGETPSDKLHCLNRAAFCGVEQSFWSKPTTSLSLSITGGDRDDPKGWVLAINRFWGGPHWDQNLYRVLAAGRKRASGAAK